MKSATTILTVLAAGAAIAQSTPGPIGRTVTNTAIDAVSARVECDIVDGVATVDLTLVVRNEGSRIGEAEWVLPLPEGAVADGFTCRIGQAEPIEGDVLDAASARQVYESIVRRRRDPGLLEFAGRGCLRARLFPIPAGDTAEVKIRWRQVLPELGGLVRWTQPVTTLGVEGRAPRTATFEVRVASRDTIRTALSPTPGADVRLVDEHHVAASFEPLTGSELPKQFALYYGLSEAEFGLHVLAHRASAGQDGYLALLVSPKLEWDDRETPPRAITLVLDVSGSMRGEKIEQAKGAVRYFLRGLRPIDRFDVVPFSTEAEPFFGSTVPATDANLADALSRVDSIEARGGTNIGSALKQGLPDAGPDGDHVPICVLLSDGKASAGTTDPELLGSVAHATVNERDSRIFVLGIGHDVDTLLLDGLAEAGRGTRQYVRPHEDVADHAAALLDRLGKPVLTDLELSIEGAGMSRITPARLPDLFAGSRLVVTGRYANAGERAVRLRGRVGDEVREYVYETTLPESEEAHDFVPKLWATRRVGALLDEIRKNGAHDELLDEVKRLGTDFQIVTPYTSHLVVEEGLGVRVPRGTGGGGAAGPATGGPAGPSTPGPGRRGGAYHGAGDVIAPPDLASIVEQLQRAGVLPENADPERAEELARRVAREMQRSARGLDSLGDQRSGERAVDDSVYLGQLLHSTTGDGADGATRIAELFVRRVGEKVFRLRGGVWVDRAFDPEKEYAAKRSVVAFDDAYFALLRELPELARYVALSDRIKIVLGETLVEITPPPEPK